MARPARPVDGRMPLLDHVREFRKRLTISVLAVLVGVVVVFVYWEPVLDFLKQPYCDTHPRVALVPGGKQMSNGCRLVAIGIFDQFNIKLKVSFIGGTVLAAPVWLYQLGAFITPALHKREKRYAVSFLVASLVLLVSGVTFAFETLHFGLQVLLHAAGPGVDQLTGIQEYLSFVTLILVIFGVAFQFPVVLVFLNVVGVLSSHRLRSWRRAAWFLLCAAAAIMTPSTDAFTFLFLAGPLIVLYEVSIVIARVRERGARNRAAREVAAQVADDVPSYVDNTPSQL